jgi:UDP-N-acetylmuramoyl-tripeptide--D-alanyl-D-alanine ligase
VKLTVKDLSSIQHVSFLNKEGLKGKKITGVSTDSRTTKPGDLFVALVGQNMDGHKFLDDAFAKGALVAMVNASSSFVADQHHPALLVEDTTRALGELARHYRRQFDIPLLAIGGSNGKTTTKEMVSAVLGTSYNVLCTGGNLNNHIGVPLTLFRMDKKHDVAVVEIGTNHPGEIAYLCGILEPTHGLITNIGREHLEFFKTLNGVADEEGELFESLKERKKAVVFVNADDPMVVARAKGIKRRVVYGFSAKRTDVKGKLLGVNETGCARFRISTSRPKKDIAVQLRIPGEHNAINALSAAAVGVGFNVPPKKIRGALERFHAAAKRMEILNLEGVLLYNDTYNANPDSTIVALRTLVACKVPGKKIAVLADMKELGQASVEEHQRVGREAAKAGVNYLLTFGEMARHIHEASGLEFAIHYEQKNMLAEYLAELIAPGDAVLVKGSRGMKMEDVVVFLEERLRSAEVPFG